MAKMLFSHITTKRTKQCIKLFSKLEKVGVMAWTVRELARDVPSFYGDKVFQTPRRWN